MKINVLFFLFLNFCQDYHGMLSYYHECSSELQGITTTTIVVAVVVINPMDPLRSSVPHVVAFSVLFDPGTCSTEKNKNKPQKVQLAKSVSSEAMGFKIK